MELMKYCVLIIDGAAGWALPERRGKTCLELAATPNLDFMASRGMLGLVRTVLGLGSLMLPLLCLPPRGILPVGL